MPSEQEQLDQLLDRFQKDYPMIAEHVAPSTIPTAFPTAVVEAKVTQGTTTAANDLSYLGASTS